MNRLIHMEKHCPICGKGGQLAFLLCDDQTTLVVICEECSSIWQSPMDVGHGVIYAADPPDWHIPELRCGIGEGSRWATRQEIEDAGFGDSIAGESDAL